MRWAARISLLGEEKIRKTGNFRGDNMRIRHVTSSIGLKILPSVFEVFLPQ